MFVETNVIPEIPCLSRKQPPPKKKQASKQAYNNNNNKNPVHIAETSVRCLQLMTHDKGFFPSYGRWNKDLPTWQGGLQHGLGTQLELTLYG